MRRYPVRIAASTAAAVSAGRSEHFSVDRSALPAVAQRVARLTRERYPDLKVPVHSRWRHFEAGGVDRKAELAWFGPAELPDEMAFPHQAELLRGWAARQQQS